MAIIIDKQSYPISAKKSIAIQTLMVSSEYDGDVGLHENRPYFMTTFAVNTSRSTGIDICNNKVAQY